MDDRRYPPTTEPARRRVYIRKRPQQEQHERVTSTYWTKTLNPLGAGVAPRFAKVAIVGKMGAGKTTLANALVDLGYTRIALADGVKDEAVAMLNLFFGHVGSPLRADRAWLEDHKAALRPFLQFVGTDLGRDMVSPSLWIDIFGRKVRAAEAVAALAGGPAQIVCDDCRFPNEVTALRALGFAIVKLVRPEEGRLDSIRAKLRETVSDEATVEEELRKVLAHKSETSVDLIAPDVTVFSRDPVYTERILAPEIALRDGLLDRDILTDDDPR